MSSPKRTIRKIASSASDMIAKATNPDPTQEKGNTIEKKSLLNTNTNDQHDPYRFEWEIEDQIYKQQDQKKIELSQNWILALIVVFVLFCGILLSYLFIFDYFSVENDNKDYTDIDDQRFRIVGIGDISHQDIIHLKHDIRSLFDEGNGRTLLGSTLRLVFNDCSGPRTVNGSIDNTLSICDGCIDDKNPANSGLHKHIIKELEKVFIDGAYDQIMSRADFWIAAATIAIQYGAELRFEGELQILKDFANHIDNDEAKNGGKFDASQFNKYGFPTGNNRKLLEDKLKLIDNEQDRDKLPPLPLMFGRTDCLSSPFGNVMNDSDQKQGPSPNEGWNYNYKWFNKNFGFNINETVAIMGAHTLGSHKQYNWVTEPYVFDNEYYSLMMDKTQGWHQETSNAENMVQFVNKEGKLSMFPCDMALLYDIDLDLDSKHCDVEKGTCSFQKDTYPIFAKYATDNQLFYNDFVLAWTKMISIGYNKQMLTRFEL